VLGTPDVELHDLVIRCPEVPVPLLTTAVREALGADAVEKVN
jgi:hypothetical protein